MTPSKALDTVETNTEVDVVAETAAAIAAQQAQEFEGLQVQTPILKIAQGLTAEVKAGDAEAGDFINSMSGESLGPQVEFIPAAFQKGRAFALKGGRYFVAIATDIIPDSWEDAVGKEFVGTRFDEHPDAEEVFKARVNRGEIKWESGPKIDTTFNFTGFVFVPPIEDSDEEGHWDPVRIAFKRTTKSAADRIVQLHKMGRLQAMWDQTYVLNTKEKAYGNNTSFIVEVKKGRPTTNEERLDAAELATATFAGRVRETGNASEAQVAPDARGGLAV